MMILRYEIPADDQWHILPAKYALHVGSRRTGVVEIWCRDTYDDPTEYRVYGTGQPMSDDPGFYEGTTYDADPNLVWHLFSRPARRES